MPGAVIELLGSPRIILDGDLVTPKRQKSVALLAYLITEPRDHSRARLASLLWPDASDGRKLLRQAVYEIKQCLGSHALISHRDSLRVSDAIVAASDIDRLSRLADCKEAVATNTPLGDVQNLCSGEFLEGFAFDGCEVMADWCYAMAELIGQRRGRLLARQVSAHRERGDTDTALTLLTLWQNLDRFSENAHQQLIEVYLQRREPRQAEKVFAAYKERLYEEFGVAPSSAIAELLVGMDQGLTPTSTVESKHSIPETHYIRSGSIFLAYQTLGSGPTTLVVVNGFMSHLEQVWENPALAGFYWQLSSLAKVVLFDKRGSGMSDRVAEPPTAIEIANDVYRLVTALGMGKVALFGFSEGGAAAIEFSARYPEITESLILYGSAAKWTRDTDYPPALTPQQFDQWKKQLVGHWGSGVSIREFAPSQARDAGMINWWAKTMRLSSSPGEVAKILKSIRDIDVRARLKDIRCPTHILHKVDDRVVRFAAAEDLARRLPEAKLTPLNGKDHWFWTEEPERTLAVIQEVISF